MEPTDDVGGTIIEPISRTPGMPRRRSSELLRWRRLIAIGSLVGAVAIVGGFGTLRLFNAPVSRSVALAGLVGHSAAFRRPAPVADTVPPTFSPTTATEPNGKAVTVAAAADVRPKAAVALSTAPQPIASTTTTTAPARVETRVHAEATVPRPVISTDTTPMSVPSKETFTVISP